MIDSTNLHSEEVLRHCFNYCKEHGIRYVVVASTSGITGVLAAEMNKKEYQDKFDVAVVTHCKGFREPNKDELEARNVKSVQDLGGKVHTGTMVFHNVNDAFKARNFLSDLNVMADTLRLFGQGTKVAVEIVLMATDAGLIPAQRDTMAIAGTGAGVDTGILILSANSRRAFKLKIKDIVLKPKNW